MPHLIQPSQNEIRDLIENMKVAIPDSKKDEMAIPSYLHPNPLVRWLFWRRYAAILNLLELNKNYSVLEFGCGIGVMLPTLCHYFDNVYAMDLHLEYARKLAAIRFLKVRFLDTLEEISDDSLDTIIAADVMEHLVNPKEYIRLFNNKLKHTGNLVISGPTENKIYKFGRYIAGFGNKGDYHHTNIDALIELISCSGFIPYRSTNLPFMIPPHLFRIILFRKQLSS